MLTKKQKISKRIFDVTLSILVFPFVIIPLLLLLGIASLILLRNGLFIQIRIGQYGRSFKLYKIRSLKGTNHADIVAIKKSETRFGRWLRKSKLDELPQLFNVLSGTMSWVGPRPDVPGYADSLEGDNRMLLELKPGITGPATIKYKNEDMLLLQQEDPLQYNDTVIWPDKVAINMEYIKNWSLKKDIMYVLKSIFP